MKLGTIDISKIYLGSTEVTSGYLGTVSIYTSVEPLDPTEPFYFENTSNTDGNIGFTKNGSPDTGTLVYYSTDKTNWSTATVSANSLIPIQANTKVYFKRSGAFAVNNSNYWYFRTTLLTSCTVGGNIMSLFYGTSFTGSETSIPNNINGGYLQFLFRYITTITDASRLMLPATTIKSQCYQNMFYNCSGLTKSPLILPATTLKSNCYQNMFNGCSSLITSPELPASTLVTSCYTNMFKGCTSLNYIKCLATDISATNCTYGWVNGVASTGTFVKDANTTWSTGNNGIPTNWTIQNA